MSTVFVTNLFGGLAISFKQQGLGARPRTGGRKKWRKDVRPPETGRRTFPNSHHLCSKCSGYQQRKQHVQRQADRPRPHLPAHPVPTSCRNDRVAEKGRGSSLARSQEPLHPSFPPLLNMIASTRDGTDNERKVSRCMTCCRAATFSSPTKSPRGLQSLFRRSASRLEAIVNSFPSLPFGRSFEPRVE